MDRHLRRQGYDVINAASSLPGYASVSPAGVTPFTTVAHSSDKRALQVPGGSNRVVAGWYATTSFTVNVDLSDGQTHDLELYFLDWSGAGRVEQVQVADAATGAVLSTQSVSSFGGGVYLDYAVRGDVLITVSDQAGPNAVLNGLFLDPAPATFTVTSTADSAPAGNPTPGTLRWAVEQADAATTPSTINFSLGSSPATIALEQGQLELSNTNEPVTIDGPGASLLSISGNHASRVFEVGSLVNNVTISGLTITGGSAALHGGGLYVAPSPPGYVVTLDNCTITGNSAYSGGGMANDGETVLNNCTISGNSASGNGGGLDNQGELTLAGCSISGNSGNMGGGLANAGNSAALTNCTISGNTGRSAVANVLAPNPNGGPGFTSGPISLTNCSITGNSGAGLDNGDGSIYGGFEPTSTLADCTISGNSGAGLNNYEIVKLTDCTISGNSGGGLTNRGTYGSYPGYYYAGTATLTACTITGNKAATGAVGGVDNILDLQTVLSSGINSVYLTDTIVAENMAGTAASDIAGEGAIEVMGSYNLVGTGGSGDLTAAAHDIVERRPANPGPAWQLWRADPDRSLASGQPGPRCRHGRQRRHHRSARGAPRFPQPDIGAFQSQGFTLTVVPGDSPQSADTGTEFAKPLSVTVTAKNAVEPVAGGVIAFTAPSSGASVTLSSGTATIGSDGVASVTATANGTAGSYSVTASTPGDASPANFALTNVTTTTATFLSQDSTTQGTWIGTYGAQGYDVINAASSLPGYATVTPAGQTPFTTLAHTSDKRALQVPGGSNRVVAGWYATNSFTVTVDLSDGQAHDLELYFLDWSNSGRVEQVQITKAATGAVLSTQTVSSFSGGAYLDYQVSGDIVITITDKGGPNAVLNGLFLDSTQATATFLELDSTTQGTWIGTYGAQGYDVINAAASLPSYASVTPVGVTPFTTVAHSSDKRALQVPGGSNRVVAGWYATYGFTVTVDLTDGQTHDLELYFLDWSNSGRVEQVDIADAATGTVLDFQTISSFSGGVYLDYRVRGNIVITIIDQAGPNAVLNGLFLDPASTTATFVQPDATAQNTDATEFLSGPIPAPTDGDWLQHRR